MDNSSYFGDNWKYINPEVQKSILADATFGDKWNTWNKDLSNQFDSSTLQGIDMSTGAGIDWMINPSSAPYGNQNNKLKNGGITGWSGGENQWRPLNNSFIGASEDFGQDYFRDGWQQEVLGNAYYDPVYGLMTRGDLTNKWAKTKGNFFFDKVVPAASIATMGYGLGGAAGLWSMPGNGAVVGATAGGGGGGLGGLGTAATETGLSTLPTAGTWAHTAAPALGAGAGEWTLPSALSGISGATTTSGGLTLGEALGGSSSGTNSIAPIEDRILSNIPSGTSTGKETSLFNQLRNVKSLSDVEKLISNNSDKALDLASTLYGIYQSNQHKGDYEDLAKELMAAGDPFGSQRGQYQKMLSDSYSNPMSIYNSPEYQGLSDLYRKKIEAKDAAAGRRSQYAGRELEMQSNFLNYLGDKRKELATLAGAGISPNISNSASASTSAIGQSNDIGTNILGLMNSLFRTPKLTRSSDSSGSSGGGIDP